MPPETPRVSPEIQANFKQVKTAIQELVSVFVAAHPEWQLIDGTSGDEFAETTTFGTPNADGMLVFQAFELVTTQLDHNTNEYRALLLQLEQQVIAYIYNLGFTVTKTPAGLIKIQLFK